MKSLVSYFGLMILFANIQHLIIRVNSSDVMFSELDQHIKETVIYLALIRDYLDKELNEQLNEPDNPDVQKKIDELPYSINEKLIFICQKVDDLDKKTKIKAAKTMDFLIQAANATISEQLNIFNLLDIKTRIDTYYSFMTFLLYKPETFSEANLENFISRVVAYDSDSVRSLFERLRPLNNGFEDKGIISIRDLKELLPTKKCQIRDSLQQTLFNIYITMALSELKGYVMLQTAYILLKLRNQGNFTNESQFMQNRYKLRTDLVFDVTKRSLINATEREIWRCDPEKYVLNKTFVYFTRFYMGTIVNLYDLDACSLKCNDIPQYTLVNLKRCHDARICGNDQQCTGSIHWCEDMNTPFDVCFADGSPRRYTYVKHADVQWGPNENCQTQIQNYTSFTDSKNTCAYCFCHCESDDYSDIYIHRKPVYADITNNYVITGLRFVKVNRIIHLQIQEGKLLAGGNINLQTVRWRPVDNNIIGNYHKIDLNFRLMDVLDLHVDEGHLITGIRFNKINKHINFQIYSTPFDYKSGLLFHFLNTSMWNYLDPKDFTEIAHDGHLKPTESEHASEPFSNDVSRFVTFAYSDKKTDARQSTIPYFDTQDTSSVIPLPLTGAGIYFKRYEKYGGFLAPKIFTYDITTHMHVP